MEKVVVGMSGGVDSTVAALFLKEKGYEVIGVTFKLLPFFDTCKAEETAKKIGIEFHVLDLVDEFKKEVIDKFDSDYKNGITPNPCVICNRNIKFKYLEDARIKYNADYIATGHYAKIEDGKIKRSSDLNKDQSYFLSYINESLIGKIIFPLEEITKEEVRKIALKYDLPSASSKDSFDVCFINGKFREYIESKVASTPGNIIDVTTNKVIGKHEGLSKYTIGQRRNVGISGNSERHYVCGKNTQENILYVAFGDSDYLYSDECDIEGVNFVTGLRPAFATARFRYKGEEYPVSLEYQENNGIRVKYPGGAKSITPGQTCAIYEGSQVIGSGFITKVYKNGKELWYLK